MMIPKFGICLPKCSQLTILRGFPVRGPKVAPCLLRSCGPKLMPTSSPTLMENRHKRKKIPTNTTAILDLLFIF